MIPIRIRTTMCTPSTARRKQTNQSTNLPILKRRVRVLPDFFLFIYLFSNLLRFQDGCQKLAPQCGGRWKNPSRSRISSSNSRPSSSLSSTEPSMTVCSTCIDHQANLSLAFSNLLIFPFQLRWWSCRQFSISANNTIKLTRLPLLRYTPLLFFIIIINSQCCLNAFATSGLA